MFFSRNEVTYFQKWSYLFCLIFQIKYWLIFIQTCNISVCTNWIFWVYGKLKVPFFLLQIVLGLRADDNTLNLLITVKLKQKLACCCFLLLKTGITSFVIGVWRQINSYLFICGLLFAHIVSSVNTAHCLCTPTLLNCSLVELPRNKGNR